MLSKLKLIYNRLSTEIYGLATVIPTVFLLTISSYSKLRVEAGSSVACNDPEEGTTTVTQDVEPGFGWFVRWNGDWSKGNALATKDEGGDRMSSPHVKIGGD